MSCCEGSSASPAEMILPKFFISSPSALDFAVSEISGASLAGDSTDSIEVFDRCRCGLLVRDEYAWSII